MTPPTLARALVAVLALGTLAFGLLPSGAWFTGTWTSSGAIITSGSLDLHVTGGPLRAHNLEPRETFAELGAFCAQNAGSLGLRYRGRFESAEPIDHNLLRYTTLRVEQHTGEHWAALRDIPGAAPAGADSLPDFFRHPGQPAEMANPFVVAGELDRDERVCYRLLVQLDPATPDVEQGRVVRFVLHLEATQAANPGWP